MPREGTQGLRARSATGLAWQTMGFFLTQPVSTVSTIILARLLVPADFGLAAMASVVTGVAGLVSGFGLQEALIQRPHLSDNEVHSAFWLNMATGFVMFALCSLAGLPAARFYHQPMLVWVLPVSSACFLPYSLSLVPKVLLARRMDFRPKALSEVVGVVAMLVVAVTLALLGAGVWSIVGGSLTSAAASAACLWRASKWSPRSHFRWVEVRPFVRFGGTLTAAMVMDYCSWNIDYLLIGRFLGSSVLGVYTLAFSLTSVPYRKLSQVAAHTTLPAFSKLQDDPERFRSGFIDTVAFAAVPAAVLLATAAVLAQEAIQGVYGMRWTPAIAPLRVLCIAGFITAVTTFMGLVFRALGRPERELLWTCVFLAGSAAGVALGLRFGTTGVAWGITIGMLVSRLPAQLDANRMVGIRIRDYVGALLPSLVAGGLAAVLAAGVRYLLIVAGAPPLLRLLVAGSAAVAATWALLRLTPLRAPLRSVEHLFVGVVRSRLARDPAEYVWDGKA